MTGVALAARSLGANLHRILSRYAWLVLLAETALALVQLLGKPGIVGTLPNSTYYGMVVATFESHSAGGRK